MAFKRISKNLPVPSQVQSAIFGLKAAQPPSPELQQQQASQPSEAKLEAATAHSVSEVKEMFQVPQKVTDPFSLLKKPITSYEHAQKQNIPLIPSVFPVGIDPHLHRTQRDNVVRNRMAHRLREVENMPSTVTTYSAQHFTDKTLDASDHTKLRLLIEVKGLRLADKQRALRKAIYDANEDLRTVHTNMDRSQYRHPKQQSLREARLTETLEREQKQTREQREKKKQLDYFQGIQVHLREIQTFARTQAGKAQKLGKAVLGYHSYVEREESKRVERTAKQRLQALKADDEDAYLKLLDQAKDTRITHLLKQTDAYLDSLSAAVAAQQDEVSRYDGPPPAAAKTVEDEIKEAAENDDDEEDDGRKVDYYGVAHKIQETITEQPSLLVGGTLKDYQIKGLQWMVSLYNNHLNGILADEMGLGKTIQTISLLTFLIEKKHIQGPFIVIVPLSTLTNWTLEFEKWAPSISKIVYKGAPQIRKMLGHQVRQGGFQVLLTTYEFIINDRPTLSKVRWMHMIIDEGHRMKNTQSKLASTLAHYYHTRHRLILTGTPLQNNLPELWALLNFVLPRIFNSVKSFDEWFNTPFANTGGQDRMDLSEEEGLLVIRRLHKVLRPFLLRRLKKDVESELPDKVERVIKCKLSGLQSRLYGQMSRKGTIFVNKGEKGFAL